MEKNELQVFNFEANQVRVVEKDSQPWWVAADVCNVLGLSNPTEAIKPLDDDEKNTLRISEGIRGNPNMAVINESGLYALIVRSNKPEAKRFRKWVTSEVLPSIRKHGAYMTPEKIEEALTNPDTIIYLAQTLKAEQEKRRALETAAKENHPKVLFAESVEASQTSILIGDLAKILKQNGHDMGQRRLFEWLRQNGYLMKEGSSRNMPTQRSMEAGWFEIKERTIDNPDGTVLITKTTKVTGKGQVYFVNLFCGKTKAA